MNGKADQCCQVTANVSFAVIVEKKNRNETLQDAVCRATILLKDALPAVIIKSIKAEPVIL